MNEYSVHARNKVMRLGYQTYVKPIFFRQDPESVHERMLSIGSFLGSTALTKTITRWLFNYEHPMLRQSIKGITFKNPIGLAGGFDKDARLTKIMPEVGFGFMEVGSITALPCRGNPKPRLWRLKESKSLVINYGLKNEGCHPIRNRLESTTCKIPLGINIAKTNSKTTVETEEGIKDYVASYLALKHLGNYITINISCPNAFGGEPFTDPKKLDQLLTAIEKYPTKKPVFLKLSPDISLEQIDDIINITKKHTIAGFISTNLTKKRDNLLIKDKNVPEKGGISGKVVKELATQQVSYLYNATKGKYILIGCGGIATSNDAYEKIKAGASLLQLITGMIFEGPQVISEINQGLVKLLKRDNYKNISEAVGVKH